MSRQRSMDMLLDPYMIREGAPAPVLVFPWNVLLLKLRYYVSIHAGRIRVSNQFGALVSLEFTPEGLSTHLELDIAP